MQPIFPIQNYGATLQKIAFAFIAIIIFAGVIVLIGWQFNIDLLKRPAQGFITVNPVTAGCFILISLSLIFTYSGKKGKWKAAVNWVNIFGVFAVSVCRLFRALGVIQWRVDFVMFSNKMADGNAMAVTTAVAFLLSSLSVVLLNGQSNRKLFFAHIIACMVFAFGFFSLLGYYYRVPEFYGKIHHVPMAVYTALCFILLSVAIWFLQPAGGITKHFFSSLTGGQASRILMPVAVIIPVTFGLLRLYSYRVALYSTELGVTLLVTSIVIVFSIVIAINTYLLNKKDLIRRTAEEQFRTLLEFAPDATIVANKDGLIKLANARTEKLFGYSKDEIIGQQVSKLIPGILFTSIPGDVNDYMDTITKVLNGNGVELTGVKKSGSKISVEATISPMMGSGEAVIYYAIRDISERKAIEQTLRISEEIYKSIVTSARDYAIFMLDVNGDVITWNKGAEAIKGYSESEIKGKNMAVFYQEDDVNKGIPHSILQAAAEQGTVEAVGKRVRKDGSVFWADVIVTALYDQDGNLRGYSKVTRDITDKKASEDTLKAFNEELAKQVAEKTEKLEYSNIKLRQLSAHLQTAREQERRKIAREIHDDLGQMLTGIRMDLVWLKKRVVDTGDLVNARLERTLDLLNDARQVARRLAANLHPTALDDLGLLTALKSYAGDFEKRAGITVEFDIDFGGLNDATISTELAIGIYRVFQESLTNILKHAEANHIKAAIKANDETVSLIVNDNGKGFEFTEKTGKNSLGLISMSERAIMLNGTCKIESTRGKGTNILLTLPITLK